MELDTERLHLLDHSGHMLVCGGPGCGKTTIALLKAKRWIETLQSGQTVLFLSFSRAAVRQISDRMVGVLSIIERGKIEVRTFHSYFIDLVRSHGRILNPSAPQFISPDQERLLRSEFDGDWKTEARRMATTEGRYVFDQLAPSAASLMEKSRMVRELYADAYPYVIVDEFQDTNTDQWRVVQALAPLSTVMCLADPDQRIFDHIEGVEEDRIDKAIKLLDPKVYDLSKDNHRSGGSGLLDYANAILRNLADAAVPEALKFAPYLYPRTYATKVHQVILAVHSHLESQLSRSATVAVLARTNSFLGSISERIAEEGTWGSQTLPAVEHELNWDPQLSAAAGLVVATVLEWPALARASAIEHTVVAVIGYYRVKLDSGTAGARTVIRTIENGLSAFQEGKSIRSKAVRKLVEAYDDGIELSGDPVTDWQNARRRLSGSTELDEMFKQVRMLRLFKATDALAWALLDSWDGGAAYTDARIMIESVLAEQAIDGGNEEIASTTLMSLHKSKGKEFDGVVIVEGAFNSFLIDREASPSEQQAARRLLRVGITRARHFVVIVRQSGARPLIG